MSREVQIRSCTTYEIDKLPGSWTYDSAWSGFTKLTQGNKFVIVRAAASDQTGMIFPSEVLDGSPSVLKALDSSEEGFVVENAEATE